MGPGVDAHRYRVRLAGSPVSAPAWWWYGRNRDELVILRECLYQDGLLTDLAAARVEARLAAMEAIAAARWPRSWIARRRFRSRRAQAPAEPQGGTRELPTSLLFDRGRVPGRHR